FYQTGFDPAYAAHGVGQVALGLTVQAAMAEGLTRYDFLHGNEAYRFDWTQSTRTLMEIELYPPGLRGALQRRTAGLGATVRPTGRWMLPRSLVLRLMNW